MKIRHAENKDKTKLGELLSQVLDVHHKARPDLFKSGAKKYTDSELDSILSDVTGKPLEVIEQDTERDNFMTAKQALEYGLIDKIIERHI